MKKTTLKLLTESGIPFDYLNPQKEMINVNDIATSLSRMTRYLGHTKRPYTVGEHSFHCLVMAEKLYFSDREKMLILIHDFTEAYVGDCPSPLKQLLPEFSVIEERIEKVICESLNIEPPTEEEHEKIKKIDMTMLTIEMKQLTKHDWEKFYNQDIHRCFVDDEDFDLSDQIREFMVKELLMECFEDLFLKIHSAYSEV